MKPGQWIVCERTSRWAAGLRTTAAFHPTNGKSVPRVIEVRSLRELAARLDEQAAPLVLIEVHFGNLASVLTWLADADARYPNARFVALLDYSLATRQQTWPKSTTGELHDVASAALEAGAADVAVSPRHLHKILAIAERHWVRTAVDAAASAGHQPLLEWSKSLLPWQDG